MEPPNPGQQEAQPASLPAPAAQPAIPSRADGTRSLDPLVVGFMMVVVLAILVVAAVVVISIIQNAH